MFRLRIPVVLAAAAAAVLPVAGPGLSAPARAASGLEGVPGYKHVFVIVLENKGFDVTWGPGSAAPYLNSLRSQGALATHYYGAGHLSADNYIAMTSGQPPTPMFWADCQVYATCYATEAAWPDGGRNIGDQLEGSVGWKAYLDNMATPCLHPDMSVARDPYQSPYATRHNPFVYYPDVVDNQQRCASHDVPYPDLATDLTSSATTPGLSFIVPDNCHNAHDATGPGCAGLATADSWLSTEVPKIMGSPAFADGGLLLITFDEDDAFEDLAAHKLPDVADCCAPPAALGGRVGLLALGSGVKAGVEVSTTYDHYSLLRTIEDTFGVNEYLNLAATAAPMADLFQ